MTERTTILVVVCAIAVLTGVGLGGTIFLAAVHAKLELITPLFGLTNFGLGALGSMLVSTRSTPSADVKLPDPAVVEPAPPRATIGGGFLSSGGDFVTTDKIAPTN